LSEHPSAAGEQGIPRLEQGALRRTLLAWLNVLGPMAGLLAIYALFALIGPPSFSSTGNLETIARQTAIVGAAALITYLQWFSAFDLGKLCLWCMIIWTGTIPLVALVTISSLATGRLGAGAVRAGRALASWAWVVVVLWYLAVIAIILVGMWDSLMLAV